MILGPPERLFSFVGGDAGPWEVMRAKAVRGEGLPAVARVDVVPRDVTPGSGQAWVLRGVVSNDRYVTRAEKDVLVRESPPLARPEALRAALIPIKKSAAWWALTQDERRAIFEERSAHIAIGRRYLPAVARRLHHGRDLGEPFDFLTWFEFRAADEGAFDDLVASLRDTEEWRYVEREVEVRLARAD
jgi:chlorite dismutase